METQIVQREQPETLETDPYDTAATYYGPHREASRHPKTRAYSGLFPVARPNVLSKHSTIPRRASIDEVGREPRRFLIPVEKTIDELLEQQDTDGNMQITIDDSGSKVFSVGTVASNGLRSEEIRGNYMISNLLQELTLAKGFGRYIVVLDEARLNENPVNRLARFIKTIFWDNLTRRIDAHNIDKVGLDPKDWTSDPRPRIYIPRGVPEQYAYYSKLAKDRPEIRLDVCWLPHQKITGEYVRDLNIAPGLLALDTEEVVNSEGNKELRGKPFVVPGGRFNELYGWDSYMVSLGLLVNDRIDLAKSMVEHFCFCIQHYGKVFNANRSYYLCRSQPPFLTDMALRVYERIKAQPKADEFLRKATQAAIKEYHGIWMSEPRLDRETGLSRYRPEGVGVPPETEASHFEQVLRPFALRHKMTSEEFVEKYNCGVIIEPELDEYFLHDRAVRESGHDTSYRLESVAANLATIDLNSLLYKYEVDISSIIHTYFNDSLEMPAEFCVEGFEAGYQEKSYAWDRRARQRRIAINKYLWNAEKGMYFDYNTTKKVQTTYETATVFWALWAGVASPRQALSLVGVGLPKFEEYGGLVSGTMESRGEVGLDRPNRQWDYPFGWAPQQILAWTGLLRYGYQDEAQRLVYKWLYMVTKAFFDFNGIVVEKYNVTQPNHPHKVDAEYGNQGSDFKGVATEGFGWVNASYVYGLTLLNAHMKRALGALIDWDTFYRTTPYGKLGDEDAIDTQIYE